MKPGAREWYLDPMHQQWDVIKYYYCGAISISWHAEEMYE